MSFTPVFPEGVDAPPVPLSPGVKAGDFVYVSGQVASRGDGSVFIGSFEDEVAQTFANVEEILAAAGAARGDIIKINAYLSNSMLFKEFNDIYARLFPQVRPARTTLITGFGHPDVRIEIECVAYLGA